MTIDECINDFEKVIFGARMMKQTEVYKYHIQLVEWLRELKAYRKAEKETYFKVELSKLCFLFILI